jgi:hypothetical protein
MSKKLKELSERLAETEKMANIELEGWDWRTRPGMESRKAQAQTELEDQRAFYGNEVINSAVGIAVTGEPATVAEFTKVATDEGEVLTVDVQEVYQRLTEIVWPGIGKDGRFMVDHATLLMANLKEEASRLKIREYRALNFDRIFQVTVHTKEALFEEIRTLVEASLGHDLLQLYVRQAIVTKALERKMTQDVVPVILTNYTPAELSAIKMFVLRNIFEIEAKEPVTPESVLKEFGAIKKKLYRSTNK